MVVTIALEVANCENIDLLILITGLNPVHENVYPLKPSKVTTGDVLNSGMLLSSFHQCFQRLQYNFSIFQSGDN